MLSMQKCTKETKETKEANRIQLMTNKHIQNDPVPKVVIIWTSSLKKTPILSLLIYFIVSKFVLMLLSVKQLLLINEYVMP